MDEDKRIKAILRYAKMLQYSTSIILVTFKDDADMAEELTEVVDGSTGNRKHGRS